jgi:UDPglucose 6-dehydrogenase
MLKVTVIGVGYVGLVTGTCLAEIGHEVLCLDVDAAKVEMLREGRISIYEPGLDILMERNAEAGRLRFTCDADPAVQFGEVQIICVDTPLDESGSADTDRVIGAARNIARHMRDYKLVVNKSTVPVGTADRVRETISGELKRRGVAIDFDVASNPEFLREGSAVRDFMQPDRIVAGTGSAGARKLLRKLYEPMALAGHELMLMDIRSSELAKYSSNAMLATRISFMNEMANLADKLGADIEQVRRCMAADPRIGSRFLQAGAGYGGSCLPKDVRALIRLGEVHGSAMGVIKAADAANDAQKHVLVDKVARRLQETLKDKRIALWGLAFKPDTDDMRYAPSIPLAEELTRRGAWVQAYDPVAQSRAAPYLQDNARVLLCEDMYSALADCDALLLLTEWSAFRHPDFERMKRLMKRPLIVDGRNFYVDADLPRQGFDYCGIGHCPAADSTPAFSADVAAYAAQAGMTGDIRPAAPVLATEVRK